MKKTLLFAAVVATTLASCSKNEITDDVPGISTDTKSINFVTTTGITRANNNDLVALQTAGGFEVFGMQKSNSAPALFFPGNANVYTWDVDNAAWGWGMQANDPDKKWPTTDADYPLQFFSIHPFTTEIGGILNENYIDNKPFDQQNWTLTPDQIVIKGNVEEQEDYLMALTEEIKTVPTNGMAKLDFKHIMSNILFSIVTPDGYQVVINDLKLKNVAGEAGDATFTVFDKVAANRGTWADLGTGNGMMSYSYFASTYTANTTVTGAAGNAAVPLYSDPTSDDTKKISPKLMPQANTVSWYEGSFKPAYDAWFAGGADPATYQTQVLSVGLSGAYIELTYAMVDAEGVCVVGQVAGKKNPADKSDYAATKFVTVAFPLSFDKDIDTKATPWKMGTKYTYNIRLGMPDSSNGVLIDPNYKDETGTPTAPAETVDNPSTAKPGDVVTDTDRRIDFTVGTVEWTDESGHDIK